MNNLKLVEAAGGLTLDNEGRVLFIFKNGRWDLPKGLIDHGSTAERTAVKEASEETGLTVKNFEVLGELIPTSHISKFAKTKSIKTIRWFQLRYSGIDDTLLPQTEEGIEHCKWFPVWELDRPLGNCPSRIHYLISFWLKLREATRFK